MSEQFTIGYHGDIVMQDRRFCLAFDIYDRAKIITCKHILGNEMYIPIDYVLRITSGCGVTSACITLTGDGGRGISRDRISKEISSQKTFHHGRLDVKVSDDTQAIIDFRLVVELSIEGMNIMRERAFRCRFFG